MRSLIPAAALVVALAACGETSVPVATTQPARTTTAVTTLPQSITTASPPSSTAPTTTALPMTAPPPFVSSAWARVPDVDGHFSGAVVSSLAATAGGVVAAGHIDSTAALWQSPDGVAWERRTGPGKGAIVNDLLPAGARLLAVGMADLRAAIWAAGPEGEWTRQLDDPGLPDSAFAQATAVAATSLGFVAVGEMAESQHAEPARAVVWTSATGDDWQRRDDPTFGDGAGAWSLSDVAIDGGVVVAVGVAQAPDGEAGPVAWYSTDGGSTWSPAAVPPGTGAVAGMSGVAAGPDGFVAVGFDEAIESTAAVWTSTDGTAWRRVEHDTERFGGEINRAMRMTAVGAGPDRLVATGFGRQGQAVGVMLWESANGADWWVVPAPDGGWTSAPDGVAFDVVASGGSFLAAGFAGAHGLVWISPPPPDLPPEPTPAVTTTTMPSGRGRAPNSPLSASLFPATVSGAEAVTAFISGVRGVPAEGSRVILVWLFEQKTGEPVERACRPLIDEAGNQVVCTFQPGSRQEPLAPGRYVLGVAPADTDPAGGDFQLIARDVLIVLEG